MQNQRRATASTMMSRTAPQAGTQASPYEQAPTYGPNAANMKNSVVLSAYEFGAMTQGKTAKVNAYDHEMAKKASLRNSSQNRYQNWGNTLEALRERKKRDRVRELANKEEGQLELDKHEAELREQQRRAAIDKANRLLFKGNDRVKSFQSSLMLSTVMQERQRQIELKRTRKGHDQRLDAMWLQIQNENLEQQYKREEFEEEDRKRKSKQLATTQLEQLKEFQIRQMQERMEEIAHGERNKRVAVQALKETAEQEELRKRQMVETNKEYLRANVEQRKVKAERKRLEALETQKIQEFASEKERLDDMRKKAEADRFNAKAERYEKMMARQFQHLQGLRGAENARVQSQVEELEQKNNDAHQADLYRKARVRQNIENSRRRQIERKQRDQARVKLEDQVMIDEWQRQDEMMATQEKAEEKSIKDAALTYQHYLDGQRKEKHIKTNLERTKELEAARHHEQRGKEDEDVFMQYAQTQIADYRAKGRSVVPMKLDLMKHERAKRRVTAM